MKDGKCYQVIETSLLQGGIKGIKREVMISNGRWVATEFVKTRCGSQPVTPRCICPQPSFGESVTTVSQDMVLVEILDISFLTISESGVQFRALSEHALYYSYLPFFLIVERLVQVPLSGIEPYARRHFVLPRQVHGSELGDYPRCAELPTVKQKREEGEPYEWVCLSELAKVVSIDPGKLAEMYLWPPYLDMPRNQPPFVAAESAAKAMAGAFDKTIETFDRRKSPRSPFGSYHWDNNIWVALPMARAIVHLTNLHFEVGDRSKEVPLLRSRNT
jgi:hypothetical protein